MDALLQCGPADGAGGRRHAEQQGVVRLDVVVKHVRDDAGDRGDADRRKRGRRGRPNVPMRDEEEQRNDDDAATDPEECAEEPCGQTDQDQAHGPYARAVAALLERLAAEPQLAGLFLDFDGVLAPIVERPEDAYPPDEARRELARLADRYALVAVVSGRAGDDVGARVDVPGVTVVGSHGLELDPTAARWRDEVEAFAQTVDWPDTERKMLTVVFHYRTAADEHAARETLEDVARRARDAGLRASFGRKVLEVLPPLEANKGTAVRELLGEAGLHRALVAGDDTTDLDAFRALDGLDVGVRVAVVSDESPPQLREAADIVVASTDELLALLRTL